MTMSKHLSVSFLSMMLAVAVASNAYGQAADDPPAFRGDPNTVYAYFDLNNPGPAQGFSMGPSTYPLDPTPAVTTVTSTNPLTYHVEMPNLIDPLFYKFMNIQVNFYWDGTPGVLPQIVSLTGHDSGATTSNTPGVPTTVGNLTPIPSLPNAWNGTIQEYLYPNPDWEEFDIAFYPGTDPIDLVVDTISDVPEPATMTLLCLGGLALLRGRRAR